MKVSKEYLKEIKKSKNIEFRKQAGYEVKDYLKMFVDNYWSKMTESKSNRHLEFESYIIRILNLNSIGRWDSPKVAVHTHVSFGGPSGSIEYEEKEFNKKLQKRYPDLKVKLKKSSIKIVNKNDDVLFKAKCKTSFSRELSQFFLKINIESAKFIYGDYFKEKQLDYDEENIEEDVDYEI